MLLEMTRIIVDPKKRNLDLSSIVDQKIIWKEVDGQLQCSITRAWVSM